MLGFRNLKIRYKLIFFYTSIFILIYTISSVFIYVYFKDTLTENIQSTLSQSTQSMVDMVLVAADTSIKNHLRTITEVNQATIQYYYDKVQQGSMTESQAKSELKELLLSQKIGTSGYIYVLNSSGILEIHPSSDLSGSNISNYDFVEDQITLKEGYIEYDWKNPQEDISRPKALYMLYFEPWDWIISVSSYREEFVDLINIEDFRDRFIQKKFGETGYSYVIGPDGRFLIHPKLENQNMLLSENKEEQKVISQIFQEKTGQRVYLWKNPDENVYREKLAVFEYIPAYKWIVASSSYTSEFYQPLYRINFWLMVIYLSALILILLINERASTFITRPLLRLKETLATASAGNLSIRSKLSGQDEVNDLSNFFNQFLDSIQSQQAALISEIEARKLSEVQLKEANERFSMILNTMQESFVEINMSGQIIDCNPEFGKLLGYPMGFFKNKTLYDLLTLENKAILKSHLKKRQEGFSDSYEIAFSHRNNRLVHCLINATPLTDASGIVTGSFGIITNITELKQLNEQLEQKVLERTQALENSLKLLKETQEEALKAEILSGLNELVSGLAHNINTPLGVCLTAQSHLQGKYRQLLADLQGNKLSREDLKHFLSSSMESISLLDANLNRTNELIKSFKLLSGVNSVGHKSKFELIAYLVHEFLRLERTNFKNVKIQLSDSVEALWIESYPAVFSMIFENLFSNTLSHNPLAQVSLDIQVSVSIVANHIRIIYREPAEFALNSQNIFDPFFTTNPGHHAGLGLTIIYNLVVKTLNGNIRYDFVESHSLFYIDFDI